jgi:hypothetical protein
MNFMSNEHIDYLTEKLYPLAFNLLRSEAGAKKLVLDTLQRAMLINQDSESEEVPSHISLAKHLYELGRNRISLESEGGHDVYFRLKVEERLALYLIHKWGLDNEQAAKVLDYSTSQFYGLLQVARSQLLTMHGRPTLESVLEKL